MGKIKQVKRNLLDDESILYACRMHWAIFIYPVLLFIIACMLWVFFSPIVGGAMFLISIYPIANAAILYATTEYALTNKRVVAFYGLFTTDLMQIGHQRMESAHVEQSFLGQILGYYTVSVRGTGTGDMAIPFLDDGNVFKKMLDKILYADDRKHAVHELQEKLKSGHKERNKRAR